MTKRFLITLALVAAPFAVQAETINLYGWQNHSWEFVDEDGGPSYDRIRSNAGNIGFSASVDTGAGGIKVNLQCEQFTYFNELAGGTGWCNRNSKIGLAHPQAGEIMFATWLLPYNEAVAQWVDPFYDAGADSHTSIMGSVGANTIFYNTGDFDGQTTSRFGGPGTRFDGTNPDFDGGGSEGLPEFNYAGGGYDTGFNRRQENIIQYWSPNWNGFEFRFAQTAGNRDETPGRNGDLDPVIRSSSLAYTNGPLWLAVTWQDHEDWTAVSVGDATGDPVMDSSDAESYRIAGRYIADFGDGVSIQISAMYEDLEYEFNGVTSIDAALRAFGYSNGPLAINYFGGIDPDIEVTNNPADLPNRANTRTILGAFPTETAVALADVLEAAGVIMPDDEGVRTIDSTLQINNANVFGVGGTGQPIYVYADGTAEATLNNERVPISSATGMQQLILYYENFNFLFPGVAPIEAAYQEAVSEATPGLIQANRGGAGDNVKIEREAWMVSGKIKFGGPVDFRFSYMEADELEVSCAGGETYSCVGTWDQSAADAWNVGLFYTMPAGTELRLTYSEVDNEENASYGQGISGTGLGTPGAEIEMWALGIVHWFD